jgi:hypothetical protein
MIVSVHRDADAVAAPRGARRMAPAGRRARCALSRSERDLAVAGNPLRFPIEGVTELVLSPDHDGKYYQGDSVSSGRAAAYQRLCKSGRGRAADPVGWRGYVAHQLESANLLELVVDLPWALLSHSAIDGQHRSEVQQPRCEISET